MTTAVETASSIDNPKDDGCDRWCMTNHSTATREGYHCHSGKTVIELPPTVYVCDRNDLAGASAQMVAVRLAKWTVEDGAIDPAGWALSSNASIELEVGTTSASMSEDETKQLIALLTFRLEQLTDAERELDARRR
jgi:hypothetical protein